MTLDLTVRQFQPADVEQVESLWQEALPSSQPWNESRDVICRKLNGRDQLFFVGEQNGRIVATVMAGYDGVRGWIYSMAVAADCRRRGIGRRMLEKAETALAVRGCPKINLQVRSTNSEVIEFYERCGFTVEDRASLGKAASTDPRAIADPVPTIEVSDAITLAQITWNDQPMFVKHFNESDQFHQTANIPQPYTDLDAEQWISKVTRQTLHHDHCRNWAIRNADNDAIGGIGLASLKPNEQAELGYWLAKGYWGQGIVTAAVQSLCKFAFDEYKLRKIFAKVFTSNPASARVLEKVGFTLEGTLRSHFFKDGNPHDVLYFGLMRQ